MADYSFVTVWKLKAPLKDVWNLILDSKSWPDWWKEVKSVNEIHPGDDFRVGNTSDLTWRSILPYTLHFRATVVKVIPMEYMEGLASGDLAGNGRWYFSHANGITQVRYEWDVSTTKAWMNLLTPLFRLLFKWNHDIVMRRGGEGMAKKLGTELIP